MSYCVNCGVELDSSAKKCALCGTAVINPNLPFPPQEDDSEKPFSDKLQIPKSMQHRFAAYIATMILLIPNIVLFFVNMFTFGKGGGYWSLYVMSSSLLFWTLFIFPFYVKQKRPYILWAADTLVSFVYVYIIFDLLTQKAWIPPTVYSIVAVLSLAALVFIVWIRRKKRHWTAIVALVLLDFMVLTFICGSIATMFSKIYAFFSVGLVCAICFLALMCFFIYCNRSKHMRAWLSKAFYV